MIIGLIDRVCQLVENPRPLSATERETAVRAFEDTMAVAHAGWHEPVTQALIALYRGNETPLLDGSEALSAEHAAIIHATAAHALDYDDVQLDSVTHPSGVLCPAILTLVDQRPELAARALPSYAVGLAVTIALGKIMGFSHYEKGWHPTLTIGAIAGAAAVAHLLGLKAGQVRSALSLAAPQAGGMQRNFGSMAKPIQAGYAAAAAVRSGLMAEAGITGADDAFGPRGFIDLYRGSVLGTKPEDVELKIDMTSISLKLYPCCYMTHRMIAATLSARIQMGDVLPDHTNIEVIVPFGGMSALHVLNPATGLEGKFCGAYTIATALIQGRVGLADFEDQAVARAPIRQLMQKISIHEEPLSGEMPVGIDHGSVRIRIKSGDEVYAEAEAAYYPGSPNAPASEAQITGKINDCLAVYARRAGSAPSLETFRASLQARLGQ